MNIFYKNIQFCPRCRGDFKKENPHFFECQNCGYKFFLNPIAANGAILKNPNGEIMFVERNFEPHKGMLDVPGGFLDMNENVEESLVREIKEELQLNMKPEDFTYIAGEFGTYEYQEQLIPIINLVYEAQLPLDQTPIPTDDAGTIHFFKTSEIPFEKIAFNGIKNALKKYQESH